MVLNYWTLLDISSIFIALGASPCSWYVGPGAVGGTWHGEVRTLKSDDIPIILILIQPLKPWIQSLKPFFLAFWGVYIIMYMLLNLDLEILQGATKCGKKRLTSSNSPSHHRPRWDDSIPSSWCGPTASPTCAVVNHGQPWSTTNQHLPTPGL